MRILFDFPSIVKKYAVHFDDCFSQAGLEHFKKAVSGFMLSNNKTLLAINQLFVNNPRHVTSFYKFFNRQCFDLDLVNTCRLNLLRDFIAQLRAKHGQQNGAVRKVSYPYKGQVQTAWAYFATHRVKGFDKKQRLVISFLKQDLTDRPNITICNRNDWYPSGILRIRRHRWPVETYHQEGKVEGLDKYQVRDYKGIQTYIALVTVAFSMLKCAAQDDDLLSCLRQQMLHTEMDMTLPLLRRLFEAEGLTFMVDYIFSAIKTGLSVHQILQPLLQRIALP